MKVKVDESICCGHARCWAAAPDYYVLDDEGYCAFRGKTVDVPAENEAAARRGADACPDHAIAILTDAATA